MLWRLKTLFPRTYWTVYGDEAGNQHFVIWRQRLGRCFDVSNTITGPAIAQQPE